MKFTKVEHVTKYTHEIYYTKECPNCHFEIRPEYVHAYNNEWCPVCGLNIKK